MRTILLSLILLLSISATAQTFQIPVNYKLEKAEDYAVYEKDVINAVKWCLNTPADQEVQKRKKVYSFLFDWINDSPNVTIELHPEIVTFMESSPDLLLLFLGGWTKYALESRDFKNKVSGAVAGLEAVLEFYTRNKDLLTADKNIDKLQKMKEKGTLKEHVEKHLN